MRKVFYAIVFLWMIAAGAVDAYRILIPSLNQHRMYSSVEMELVEWVKSNTDPNSVWLTSPHHNNWLFNLTGRQPVMGYPGWLWTHGYYYEMWEKDLKQMFHDPMALDLFEKYRVSYVVIGPEEISRYQTAANLYARAYAPVKTLGPYKIYKVR